MGAVGFIAPSPDNWLHTRCVLKLNRSFTVVANWFDRLVKFPKLRAYEDPISQVLVHRAIAGVSPLYKASKNLRRVTAATSVTTFLLASATALLLASCRSNSSQSTYDAAIQEGQ